MYQQVFGKMDVPMVVLASPGMINGGKSMEIFLEWCQDSRNTLIIPGYCSSGTLGHYIQQGHKILTINDRQYEINMEIMKTSFSAHADSKGIVNLI